MRFSDGLVITAARAPYQDLAGSRVEAINGRPIGEVLALVEPLAPRDNPSNLLAYGPITSGHKAGGRRRTASRPHRSRQIARKR